MWDSLRVQKGCLSIWHLLASAKTQAQHYSSDVAGKGEPEVLPATSTSWVMGSCAAAALLGPAVAQLDPSNCKR